jgi:hypothetical protein
MMRAFYVKASLPVNGGSRTLDWRGLPSKLRIFFILGRGRGVPKSPNIAWKDQRRAPPGKFFNLTHGKLYFRLTKVDKEI